jgi:hypothetical protein
LSYRSQSSTSNSRSNRPPTSPTSGTQEIDENESFLNNRDAVQAIADEETIDSVEQATTNRVEMISQAMKNYLLKSREKRSRI